MSSVTTLVSHSPEETRAFGRELSKSLEGGDIVTLQGPIGAGKSVLARGIGEGLGVGRWRGSPTFTLVNEYDTAPALYHVDLYRLTDVEVADIGLDEYCRPDSILVVEWPERAPSYLASLPRNTLTSLQLEISGEHDRTILRSDDAAAVGTRPDRR